MFFWLFLLVPLLVWWELKRANANQATVMVSSVRAFRGTRSWKNFLRPVLFILRLLTWSCLIIALARPQTTSGKHSLRYFPKR